MSEILSIPVDQLVDSPSNPRRSIGDITELAASIRSQGVMQPICVRALPPKVSKGKRIPAWQIVYGHRRVRAARSAELETIPALVRELTDRQVLELQLGENSQRVDVHPLEEADALEELRDKHRATVEEMAAQLGRPVSWVRGRLRLCDLVPEGRDALIDGRILIGVALMLTRLEGARQAEAVEEVAQVPPLQMKEAKVLIERHFFLRLKDAPFDVSDAALVPSAGACGTCPHRTGSQLELYSDAATPDMCTRRPCWEEKVEATWVKKSAAAQAAGRRVIAEDEADEIFEYGSVTHESGLVDLDGPNHRAGWDPELRAYPTWRESIPDAEVIIARDPDGRIRELAERPEVSEAAVQATASEFAKRQLDREIQARTREALEVAILKGVEDDCDALLVIALSMAMSEIERGDFDWLGQALGLELELEMEEAEFDRAWQSKIRAAPLGELRALAVHLALRQIDYVARPSKVPSELVSAAEELGLDVPAIRKQAERKARAAAKKTAAAK